MELQFLLNPVPIFEDLPAAVSAPNEPENEDQGLLARHSTRPASIPRMPLASLTQEPATEGASPSPARYQSPIPSRPGRKAKPIAERTGDQFAGVRKRMQRSYTREFKIEVLRWWYHHRIPEEGDGGEPEVLRAPLMKEVSERYLVPITTLHNWRVSQDQIVSGRKGERKNRREVNMCHWPELEARLYDKYRERREEYKAVRRGWLHREANRAFTACYPNMSISEFHFSDGWLAGFLSRHRITLRFATNKAQKIPEEYLQSILSWLRFNRRNSQIRPATSDEERVVGRYLLESICNIDETPLPFEFLDGQTYADKGSHTVQVKASNSGWDKRQATLLLTVFGNGKSRIRPLIIFKGKERYEGRRAAYFQRKREEEMARYDARVDIRWNESAYSNSALLVEWIKEVLVPALPPGPRLLALDVAKFHSTDEVLHTLRSNNIVPSMIPAGCTGLVQPLDVSVNKPFKNILRDLLENLLDDHEATHQQNLRELHRSDISAIAERRILVTQAVGQAWEQFSHTYQELVVNTFRQLGLTLPIDGSYDSELSIKGIDPSLLEIGDWGQGGENSPGVEEELASVISPSGVLNDENSSAVEFIDRD